MTRVTFHWITMSSLIKTQLFSPLEVRRCKALYFRVRLLPVILMVVVNVSFEWNSMLLDWNSKSRELPMEFISCVSFINDWSLGNRKGGWFTVFRYAPNSNKPAQNRNIRIDHAKTSFFAIFSSDGFILTSLMWSISMFSSPRYLWISLATCLICRDHLRHGKRYPRPYSHTSRCPSFSINS